jgi:hypothetical protein
LRKAHHFFRESEKNDGPRILSALHYAANGDISGTGLRMGVLDGVKG